MNRVVAIIVTYYPDKRMLIDNVNAFINSVEKVLIWENTPKSEIENYRYISHSKIEYCGDGINSISHALNYVWKYSIDYGYDYIMVMDQDSLWDSFDQYLENTIYSANAPVGIWGPRIVSKIDGVPHGSISDYKVVSSVINSGTLVSVDIVNKVGGWNELFAVDCVDDDFCLRAKRMDVNTYRIENCNLIQRYGSPRVVKLWGHIHALRNDSPRRLFSIYRSFVILLRLYPEATAIKKDFVDCWIKPLKWTFVFEEQRFKKLFAVIRGLLSGYLYKVNE